MLSGARKRQVTGKITESYFFTPVRSQTVPFYQIGSPPFNSPDLNQQFASQETTQKIANQILSPSAPTQSSHSLSSRGSSVVSSEAFDANAFNDQGRSLFKEGKTTQALMMFSQSLSSLGPSRENTKTAAVAYCGIAECYEKDEQFSKAIEFYEKAISIATESTESSWANSIAEKLGYLMILQGNSEKALFYFQKTESKPSIKRQIAFILDDLNKKNEALKMLHEIEKPETYDLIAALYQELGNQDQADDFYKKSFESPHPKGIPSFAARKPLKEAFNLIEKTRSPLLVGRIYKLFEEIDKGFNRLVRSVEAKERLFPGNPRVALLWKELAAEYEAHGKMEKAEECRQKAYNITSSPIRRPLPSHKEIETQMSPNHFSLSNQEIGAQMSPNRSLFTQNVSELIVSLNEYKSGKVDKRNAAKTLTDLLKDFMDGKKSADAIISYCDTELKKENNPIFSGIFSQQLSKHFLRAQSLFPKK